MKILKISTILLLTLSVGFLFAQDQFQQYDSESSFSSDNWNIGLGVSYRNFRKPKFNSAATPSYKGLFSAEQPNIIEYNNTNIGKFGEGGLEIVNVVYFSGGVSSARGRYSFEESLAPVLGMSLELCHKDNMNLSLVANLQYFSLDSASRKGSFSGGDEYTRLQYVMHGIGNPEGEHDDPEGVTNYTNYLSGNAKTKFDLDLWVIDLGLSFNYIFQNGLQAFVSAGPSLSIADMESTSYTRISSNQGALAKGRGRDNDTDIVLGLYASLGASYWITEQVGLSFELRYDDAFNKVDTKYVTQDLDAFGGIAKCIFRF